MKKYLFNIKYIVLGTFVAITSCVSDDLADVGDLEDITGPTPFYSVTDVTSSVFNCNKEELSANYDFNFQAGSNLAVNGTNYQWTVTPSEGVTLINKNLPILKQLIEVDLASVIAIEKEIAKREFKLPCETNPTKIAVLQDQIAGFEADLAIAEAALSDETLQNVADLESQIAALETATLEDQELIFSFPSPGEYTIGLTVTDNLGKSNFTEKKININQAIPTIPIPEIGDPGFEDGNLFLSKKDGTGAWRVPGESPNPEPGPRSLWNPFGLNSFAGPQINTKSEGVLPEGTQAGKFPSDGSRVLYQRIEVTPGASYVLTYFSEFKTSGFGSMKVSILNQNTSSFPEAQLEANIIATRTDTNIGRTQDVFKKHAITFEAGENETVIIFATNTGVEARLDAFGISVKQ